MSGSHPGDTGSTPVGTTNVGTTHVIFGLDLRSLALFRIALASVLLWDLADRSRDLIRHYTDAGILPADALLALSGRQVLVSLHYWASSSAWAEGALFVLAGAAAIGLLVGYRTWVLTLVCWYLLGSLQVRNPGAAAMGGDRLLLLWLFWSLLLPLGARFSLDARRRGEPPPANAYLSLASAALLLQLFLVYFVTGVKKHGPTWHDGSAVYLALHLDTYATSIGVWLRQYESVLPLFTHLTRWFEILAPCLLFVPVFTGWIRMGLIGAAVLFHLSLALCLNIGPFPAISLVGWCALLPREFWDDVVPRLTGRSLSARGRSSSATDGEPLNTPLWAQAGAAACSLYVVAFVIPQIHWFGLREDAFIRGPLALPGQVLRLNQYWSMFSPDPKNGDAWLVLEGERADGTAVDPSRDAPVSLHKPRRIVDLYDGYRHRLWVTKLLEKGEKARGYEILHTGLADYYCRTWNERHPPPERILRLRTIGVLEFTLHPEPLEPREYFVYDCAPS